MRPPLFNFETVKQKIKIMERLSFQDIPQELFTTLRAVEDFIHTSDVDMKTLELIRLRASQINACAYCLDMHYKEAIHAGESELRLSMLAAWQESGQFSRSEEAVLEYTEAVTTLNSAFELEQAFNRLKEYFTKQQIAIISLTITQINTWNRLMKAFAFQAGHYKVG